MRLRRSAGAKPGTTALKRVEFQKAERQKSARKTSDLTFNQLILLASPTELDATCQINDLSLQTGICALLKTKSYFPHLQTGKPYRTFSVEECSTRDLSRAVPWKGKRAAQPALRSPFLVGTPTAVRAAERPQCQTPAIVGRQTMRSRRRSITVRGARLGGLHRRCTQLRWKSSIGRIK